MDICGRYYSPRNMLRTGPTDHGRLVGKREVIRILSHGLFIHQLGQSPEIIFFV